MKSKYLAMAMLMMGSEIMGYEQTNSYFGTVNNSIPKQSEESAISALEQAKINREKKRARNLLLVKKGSLKGV